MNKPIRFTAVSALVVLCLASTARSAVFVKTNNVDNLNLVTSWTNNAVPGSADIAQWDATVSDPNNSTNTLGAGMSWSGIKIINPAANIQINAGGILTNGASGIDMTAATVDLALSNTVQIAAGAQQQWNVASGRTLSVLAIPTKPGQPGANTGQLQVGTTGTVRFGSVAATTIADNQGNPWVTYGLNDWAALDSSGNVVPVTYTAISAAPLVAGVFNDIIGDIAGGSGSAVDIPGLRFNDSTFHTLNIANSGTSRTFTCRGILVTANSGGGLISGSAASSFIRPARSTIANTSWNIIQNSPNDFTIGVNISDGSSGAPNHLVKSGPGNLIIGLRSDGTQAGTGSGGMDVNGGTLTITAGASTGSGAVAINNGRLVLNASNTTFVARLTVNSGATNRINVNTANAQQYISSVTFNGGPTTCGFNYANGVSFSATTAPLLVSNLIANGSITVNIYSGSPAVGIFPLIKYTNSLTGAGFSAFNLGVMPLRTTGYLSNDVANTSIDLVVTNIAEPLEWATGSGTWDIATTPNWKDAMGNSTTYQEANGLGDAVVFEDTLSGSSPITVTLNATAVPGSVTVSAAKNYTITGSGNISGGTSLAKSGSGTLYLQTANSFSGGININGGVVNFTTIANLGAGNINFGGGTLQYNGNTDDISTRTVSFGAGGGTIDTAGQEIFFNNPVGTGAGGGLTKTGLGTLTLNGTNKYVGNTVVGQGTLALLSPTTYISNSAAIIVNSGAILDASSSGLTLQGSPVQILAGSGSISGTVVSSNGIITPGTNGVVGTLTFNNDLTLAGGTLNLDLSADTAQRDLVVVSGNLNTYGGTVQLNVTGTLTNGIYKLIQCGNLSSGTGSSANLTLAGYTQAGKSLTLSDAISGEIDLVVAPTASDNIVWTGTDGATWDLTGTLNWQKGATQWAYTNGDLVTFDEIGIGAPNVALQAAVTPSSVVVSNQTATYAFNDGTFVGGGKISGATSIVKKGPGTLIINTPDNNTGPTDIQNGTVQVGNGSGGDLGSGNVTNNGMLVFNQGDSNPHTVSGQISGNGQVVAQGASSSAVILAGNNSYAGPTTISSGSALQVGAGGATGSLGSGAITNDGTLTFNRSGSVSVGNIKAGPANQGALTLAGTASYTLNGGNTYINNTTVQGGAVTLAAANVVPSSASVAGSTGWFAVDGGTVDLNGIDLTVNALSGTSSAAAITNTAASATTTNMITVLGTAGTTYSGSIIGNPSGSKIGLTLLGTSELRLAGNCSYSGPTLVASGATLGVAPGYVTGTGLTVLSNNATFYLDANSPSVSVGNAIFIPDNSTGIITSRNPANQMGTGSSVSGGPTATNLITGANSISFGANNVKQFQNFSGTVYVTNGAGIRFSSTSLSVNGGDNATFQVDGTINTRNGTTASGAGISLGAVMGSGTLSGGGTAVSSVTTFNIGGKGIDATFSGTIADGGAPGPVAIVKNGAGRQTLDGTLSYSGATTVNQGVLAIASISNPSASLDTSGSITVTSNAVLDVSARSDSTLNLGNSIAQTLSGYGTIQGSLNEAANSFVNVGLGTLNVSSGATLDGAITMQLNRTNGVTHSQITAANFSINGPLTVTNVGPAFQGGETFQLFSTGVTGFTATNLPTLTGSLYWTNKLAVDGTLAVINPIATYPTNITATVNGNSLQITWPATHLGWMIQVQTNNLSTGLNTNWVTISNTASVLGYTNAMDPANGSVFYRLRQP